MLGWLQEKAWGEVRSAVFMTIGRILPTEITEVVVEWTLQAEEVPACPSIIEIDLNDSDTDEGDLDSLSSSTMRVKEKFQCKSTIPWPLSDDDPEWGFVSDFPRRRQP
jgi:hypothetical protein